VNESLQRFGFDPILAALFLAFAVGGAGALVLLFDRWGGRFAQAATPASQKLATLDGLRGILAFSVVAHHAYCWYFFTQFGVWSTGRSVIFDRLAGFGVAQFFYLSGFLFWRKLMRRGQIPADKFYLSRFVRIGPVYYVCIGTALLIGFAITGFKVQVATGSLIASLLQWILFSLGGQAQVNHSDIGRITCGVTWTLALEWLFYLSLPFLGWFARKAWRLLFYALAFGILFLLGRYARSAEMNAEGLDWAGSIVAQYAKFMLIGFGGGILIAAIESSLRDWLRPIWSWRNWIVLALFLAYLATPRLPAVGQVLLLAGFALIVTGADLFGLLVKRGTRLLGAISYPIYLVHGIVYYAAMRLRGGIHIVNLLAYMGETALCLVAILLLASALHLVVERPTMKLSEQIARAASVPQSIAP
jgi:peptidoglycan/LPS O-acetylase OafA/YrhL